MNTTKQIPENKQKRTPKIEGLDFVRSFCAIGIVIYHFYCHSSFNEGFMVQNASSRWGDLFVYVFFIVSGLCIYKSNPEVLLTKFYYKRWRSIFPSFYVAYLGCLLLRLAVMPDNGPTPPLWTATLTAVGLDGYFLYCIPNFYLLGEWFLGAIILIVCPISSYADAVQEKSRPIVGRTSEPDLLRLEIRILHHRCRKEPGLLSDGFRDRNVHGQEHDVAFRQASRGVLCSAYGVADFLSCA
ncbi:MAG: acyltransferase [Paludibacteraceae bacterium]|nr:acyltransferase [Paludibacteraceae bacterium]